MSNMQNEALILFLSNFILSCKYRLVVLISNCEIFDQKLGVCRYSPKIYQPTPLSACTVSPSPAWTASSIKQAKSTGGAMTNA